MTQQLRPPFRWPQLSHSIRKSLPSNNSFSTAVAYGIAIVVLLSYTHGGFVGCRWWMGLSPVLSGTALVRTPAVLLL